MLGVSTRTLRRYLDTGLIAGFKVPGRGWRIYRASVESYIRGGEPDYDVAPY